MIAYILKILICSAIFLGIYYLILAKEKMYSFNRYYLLLSLIAIFVIPSVKIGQIKVLDKPISDAAYPVHETVSQFESIVDIPVRESTSPSYNIIAIIYAIVSGGLIFRFFIITLLIIKKVRKHQKVDFSSSKLVLINESIAPHSFFNYIFINKNDYENVPAEILVHERVHTRNKHTFDVIFIEILITFFWFNPFLYLYRQVIKLNHEFLADQAVLAQFKDISNYQTLLINTCKKFQVYPFSSQLNFNTTKKRFIMMTKPKSMKRIIGKQIALVPILSAMVYFFSDTTVAQDDTVQSQKVANTERTSIQKNMTEKKNDDRLYSFYAPATAEGASDQQMIKYASIIDKYKTSEERSWWKDFKRDITEQDKKRLESLFLQMNRDQQEQQKVVFIKSVGSMLTKKVPTEEQIESWKDPKLFGLWIDGRRVENATLDNFHASDFSHLFVSRLAKNAKNYGKHFYQVDLMTNEYFEDITAKREGKRETYNMAFHLKRADGTSSVIR